MLSLVIECLDPGFKDDVKYTEFSKDEDAGFDLMCPKEIVVPKGSISFKIPLGVRIKLVNEFNDPKHYLLMPRSSMGSKTPLRLSNSIGLIDSTYRGELIAIVDNISDNDYTIKKLDRLVQIVPFSGKIINAILGIVDIDTERGEGGLGSTGR